MLIDQLLYDKITILTGIVNIAIVEDNIFAYYAFEPSVSSNTASIDYNTITAIAITGFINMSHIDTTIQQKDFIARFIKYVDQKEQLTIKFSKNSPFWLFSR